MGQACGCFAGVAGTPADSKAQQVKKPDEKIPLVAKADEPIPLVPAPSVLSASAPEASPVPLPSSVEPEKPRVASTEEVCYSPSEGAEVPEEEVCYSPSVEVGSFMEVFSNSSQAWCPGVIYDMDTSSVLMAYRVPCEPSVAENSIRIKTLPLDSPELRVATDTGAWLGADVEVFSDTNQQWCPGKIHSLKNSVAEIVTTPSGPEVEKIMKLQLGDRYIQLPGAKAAMQYSTGADGFACGSPVEIYSNSLRTWCYGVIQLIVDGTASIAFYYPDMDPQTEAPAIKELPLGHPDFRLPTTASAIPESNAGVPESELAPGVAVEVYSESRQYWIPGKVAELKDGIVTVTLYYPDMPPDEAEYNKELPVGHVYLRLPVDGLDPEAP